MDPDNDLMTGFYLEHYALEVSNDYYFGITEDGFNLFSGKRSLLYSR